MGLLQNLRDRRNQQTRVERNTETLRREFSRELTKEDLSDMIRLMDEPEVYKPLFENAEAFGRQPEMDDILRAKFQLRALDILGRDSEELESVMSAFNNGSNIYEADKDTRRLSDKLLLAGQDEYESVTDRIANRIQTTRQDINDRVAYQQEKVKNKIRSIDRSIERRVRPFVDVVQDSVKGMLQGVKDRVQAFKDDYRTRRITIENAQNWEIALEKGVSAEQIESVIEHADYPEVRYGVMKHASALFEQDAMTPELATELFYAYQPHTNAQNEMHERFYKQLETYANTVVEQAETNELSVSPNEYAQQVETPKESAREIIEETPLEGDASKNYFLSEYGAADVVAFENSTTLSRLMSRNGIDTLPDLPRTDEGFDVRQAQLLGISDQGDAVWGVPDNGEIRHLSDDELEEAFMRQYGKAIDTHDIPFPDESDAPVEDEAYDFFDSLAKEFNQQWNDEDELMASSAPFPTEQDAPPLLDEDDVPPLSFDGLDVQQLQEM